MGVPSQYLESAHLWKRIRSAGIHRATVAQSALFAKCFVLLIVPNKCYTILRHITDMAASFS